MPEECGEWKQAARSLAATEQVADSIFHIDKPHGFVIGAMRISGQCRCMKIAAQYFREKAVLCRQIADELSGHDDQCLTKLIALAEEFEANAQALEKRLASQASHSSGLDEILSIH